MKKINSFASEHPVTFGVVVTFVFILMVIASNILGNLWPGENIYGQPGNMLGRLISIAILIVILLRLGWLRSAGFTLAGSLGIWLISLLSLVCAVSGFAYTLNGNLYFNISGSVLTIIVVVFILTQSIMEEVVFRGLVLQGFLRAWGNTSHGILKSVLVSSLLFCSIHLLDFLGGRLFLAVFLQSLEAFFLGVILAVLVIRGKSIYPAFFFHGILNIGAYLSFSYKGLEPSPASWLSLSLMMLLPALFGMYLLRKVSNKAITGQSAA